MRTRAIPLAVAIAALLTLGIGVALAAPRYDSDPTPAVEMHRMQDMRAMHARMSEDAREQCNEACAQMSAENGSMMGGSMHATSGMPHRPEAMHGGDR